MMDATFLFMAVMMASAYHHRQEAVETWSIGGDLCDLVYQDTTIITGRL